MIYDSLTLAACIAELRSSTLGSIVHQVRQPNEFDVIFVTRTNERHADFILSCDSQYARALLTTSREKVPQNPLGFCQLLRKHLEGSRIESIDQVGYDRVMRIVFRRHDGPILTLMHEIMGRHSNIILLTEEERILGAAKVIGPKISRVRQIMPGRNYEIPPATKTDLFHSTPDDLNQLMTAKFGEVQPSEDDLVKWMASNILGFSPTLAREAVTRAQPVTGESLQAAGKQLLSLVSTHQFSPVLIRKPGINREEVYPIHLSSLPESCQFPRDEISSILEATLRSQMQSAQTESVRTEISGIIKKSLSHLVSQREELDSVLEDTELPGEIRRQGDTLAGSYHLIVPGQELAEVPDYYDPEVKLIKIPIRPDMTPNENIERYYKTARKAEDRMVHAAERLPHIKEQIRDLGEYLEKATATQDVFELGRIREQLKVRGLVHESYLQTPTSPSERPFDGKRISRHLSSEGLEILIGENAEANDYLTSRVARPDDVWLHARSVTGAHVVIRLARGQKPPQRTLQQAAEMAASHSDAKHSSYIPVDWTLKKHVRKPRSAPAGTVTYTHEKTIHITKDK